MKKPKKKKPPKKKASASRREKPASPLLDVLANMDDDTLAMMMRQAMQGEMGFDPSMFDEADPVELFSEYLDACAQDEVDEEERNELLESLVPELNELKIDSNGGHRESREKIQAIHDLLDNAIENHILQSVDLMITAKAFADAGWLVPDSLKQAVAKALQTSADAPDGESLTGNDIVSSLLEAADVIGQNPFDLHDHLNSLAAGLPPEATIMLLSALVAGKKSLVDEAAAGFVLHPDPVVAQAVGEALAASATQTPATSALIERLVRMRPWLPPARQVHLDMAIRAMRLNALPPVKSELPKIIKCYVSICDGSGTRSLLVTQRAGADYQLATAMMKLEGVADALVLRELPKSEMDDMVRQLKSATPVVETDLAGVGRTLGLAIADNFASGNLPPFKLVEVVESLGLGPIHVDHASPSEIITSLLADLPPEQKDPAASARAHADMLRNEFDDQWFEAGEALEELLYPVKSSKQRVAKLMKDYLPGRRSFWTRQCALSALAMHGDPKNRHALWRQMALVGRDIASDKPLEQIPLMKQIAKVSVQVFESGQ